MRNKEVEDAIKKISSSYDDNTGYYEAKGSDWCAVHRYIEELEKETKEIEFDLTSVYMSGFYDGEKKYKDKIRDKIKEWDKNIKWNNSDDHYYAIKNLKDLLGD